jgi:hypothetical protein
MGVQILKLLSISIYVKTTAQRKIATGGSSLPVFSLIQVSQQSIVLGFYNLYRDCVDRIANKTNALGQWFIAR